jgi:WD40 repeat protein
MYRTMLPKTLEFGHEFTCSYTKHGAGGQVKNIFYNKNIRSFVSYNEKQLHVWNAANGQQVMNINFFDETQSHTISTIVYSATHQLYLAISTDFKLHIFNEHLILIGWFPLKVRLVHFAYFYEEKSTLITAGIDGCFMFKINVKSKYEPKQAVLLDPEGNSFHAELGPRIKLEKMPLWIKGLKVNEKQNIIFSWSQLKACFNDLDGKILYRYKKLTTYEDYITDLIVSEKYKYFVTSTFSGSVIVWKLQRKKEMIHSFNAHTKSVTSLQEIPDQPTLFLSASNDNTIRIFSLDKFTELYSFILPAGVTNINLLSEKIFACFYNDQIKIGKLHHLALSFHSSNIEVKQIKKMFRNSD